MAISFLKKTGILLFTTAVLAFGCTDKKADQITPEPAPGGCDTISLSFAEDILPILQQNCALGGCHNTATQSGSYVFESYTGFMEAVNNNRVLGAINHQQGFVPMPKNAPMLSDCDIMRITHWIESGAANN